MTTRMSSSRTDSLVVLDGNVLVLLRLDPEQANEDGTSIFMVVGTSSFQSFLASAINQSFVPSDL